MSIPKWLTAIYDPVKYGLVIYSPPTHDQLNELVTLLESNQSIPRGRIVLFQAVMRKVMMEAIFKGMHKDSKIHNLSVCASKQRLTKSMLKEWVVGLQIPSLTTFELFSNTSADGSIQPWIRLLQLNMTITSLQFPRCHLNQSDVNELVDLLSSNYTITHLVFTLESCLTGPNDFSCLWTHLKSNLFIKSLMIDFGNEMVRDCDGMALAEVLRVNITLTSLTLQGTKISSSGRSAFAEALNYNTTLHLLSIPYNSEDIECQKLIASRLQRNSSLVPPPLTLLLRQTELAKETERRRIIKQTKLDVFKQSLPSSLTKSVHQLSDKEKEEIQSANKKPKLEEVSASSTICVAQSSPVSVRLNEHDVEYLRVRGDFHESFACMPDYHGLKFNVTQIERITNSSLTEQFNLSYQYFMAHNYHSTHPIRSVYHSTKPENISGIIQSNLHTAKAGSVTDSGWFGKGMYFSPHADYTLMYYSTGKFKRVVAGDSGKILQFDILPGRMFKMKDVKIGGARTPYYDSHVSPNEFEYVMFDSRHILPRYVISFRVVQGVGYKFHGSVEQVGPKHPNHIQPPAAAPSTSSSPAAPPPPLLVQSSELPILGEVISEKENPGSV